MTEPTRRCPKCDQVHPIGNFYLRKKAHGRMIPGGYCKPCTQQRSKESHQAAPKEHLRERNRRWLARQSPEWHEAERNRKAEALRLMRAALPMKSKKIIKPTRDELLRRLERRREMDRALAKRRRSTPEGTLKNRITAGMNAALARAGAARKDRMNWESLVGYTLADLKAHLEARFLPGMTWENRSEWHIDHIRPLASFNFDGPLHPEFREAWGLDNLQPLWRLDNQKKHAKLNWTPQPQQERI